MLRALSVALPLGLLGCGARTSLDLDVVGSVDAGTMGNAGALGDSSPKGALCGFTSGVVSSCAQGDGENPVQRCEGDERCVLLMLPDPGGGEAPRYECCSAGPSSCATRQFAAGFMCK